MSERVTFADLLKKAEAKKSIQDISVSSAQPNIPNIPKVDNQPNIPKVDNQPNIPKVDNQPNIPNQSLLEIANRTKEISPKKDFTKVANSIAREAVPQRLFRGMSKNTYDALYAKTRGAISPIRKIRATKSDLIRWAGVSDVTIDKHLKQLVSVGLLKVEFMIGSHEGNWYEVYIPEEIESYEIDEINITNLTNLTNLNIPKKVGGEIPKKVGGDWGSKNQENKGSYEFPNTLIKTNTDDDEKDAHIVFSEMIEKLEKATKKLTGKKSSRSEAEKWGSLADLLILELEKAAKNTNSISSVPAFLTEVLRRQFFASNQTKPKVSKNAAKDSGKTKPDLIGKSDEESFAIKPLDEQGREEALAQLQDFAEDDFLESFKKWYTEDDWRWLTEKLKES